MDFMTNVVENTATVMFGKHLLNFSIIFHSPLSLKIHSSVFTEDFHLQLKLLITFVLWKEFKKFHMKDQCVIFCGQILMIVQDGEWIQEALVTLSVKTLLKVSITLITWKWLLVHISWWWRYFFLNKFRDTQQLIIRMFQQSFQLQTIVTDVEIKLLLWMLMKTSDKTTFNSTQHQEKEMRLRRREYQIISFDF